jgi:hypothetical protein
MSAKAKAKQAQDEIELTGRWYRGRGFGLGPFGEKWWVAGLNRRVITPTSIDVEIPVIAAGVEVIEVVEVTPDGTAHYRRYLINPDGELVTVSFAPQYDTIQSAPVGQLRGTIKRMKMTQESLVEFQIKVQQKQRRSAEIIQFPVHRIVRRIEHGRVVPSR